MSQKTGIAAESVMRQDKTAIAVLQQEKKTITTVYDTFLQEFDCKGKTYYYAYAKLKEFEYPILLIAQGTYNINELGKVTTGADIYYPINQKIQLLGSIHSVGTAYPLAFNSTGIFEAGGHEVTKYTLDLANLSLKLISKYMTIYTGLETGARSVTIAILGDEQKVVTEDEFLVAYKEYGDAELLYFTRLIRER